MKRQHYRIALVLILVAATLIRVWGLNYDLPGIYHPDEPDYIRISQRIFKTGDLNPHAFNYPSLFFYLQALAYAPYYAVGRALGDFQHPEDIAEPTSLIMGVTQTAMPSTVIMGRSVTVGVAVASVLLVTLIGKQLTGQPLVGLLAGTMLAISPTHVFHGRFITPDAIVTFFAVLTTWFAVKVLQEDATRHYLATGVALGLTAGSKYNGALIALVLITAHFLRHHKADGKHGLIVALKDPRIYVALALGGITFLLTTPFALLDFTTFIEDFTYEAQHYATGHTGQEGDTVRFYLTYLLRNTGAICILALLAIVRIPVADWAPTKGRRLRISSTSTLFLAIFPVVYFIFINRFVVRNDRMLMPFLPFLFLLAADQLGRWWTALSPLTESGRRHPWRLAALTALTLVMVLLPLSRTVSRTLRLVTVDSRETARVWINENLPAGARIAIEAYAPYINVTRFSVQPVGRIIDHAPAWYQSQEIDYLVFAEGMFGRFYGEPDRYGEQVQQYEAFFECFALVRDFDDGGYDVYLYRLDGKEPCQSHVVPADVK
ncbi:MAG: ArnT family glycosyltransferase [Anaerolineae bacterium]